MRVLMVWRNGLLFAVACMGFGCTSPGLKLPAEVTCAYPVFPAANAEALAEALATAAPGTCVVAAPGRYAAALSVPEKVTLLAESGTIVEMRGETIADRPVVSLAKGATLAGISVLSAAGVGVSVETEALLASVSVNDAHRAGVVVWCEDDCRVAPTVLNNVEMGGNAVGLIVHGAQVKATGGSITGSQSFALASGYGVVASHGADLEMTGTVVEGNEELGVLVDGKLGTQAALHDVTVKDNRGRGVWAQDLAGSTMEPKLRLSSCAVEGNRLVGVGARSSLGIRIEGGSVSRTVMGQTASDTPGVFVKMGDGIGLFEDTGQVQVDAVLLEANQRSQVLIDKGGLGLKVADSTVTSETGQLGVVVQRTTALVVAPQIVVPAAGEELPLSAPALAVPNR